MRLGRILNSLLVLFACWSSFAMAFDAATCSALKSNNNFSIKYSISEAKLREVIYVEKGVGNAKASASPIALWTNSQLISSPVIKDKVTEKDKSYNIWLTYDTEDTANKQGILYYYLLQDGSWQLIESTLADLTDLDSVNIDILGSQVSNLECESALTLPPLPEAPTPLGVCDFFPQPVQSWITKDTNYSVYDDYPSSELNLSDVTASISGWSDNYLADSQNIYTHSQDWPWPDGLSWPNLRVGFDKTTDTWISYVNSEASGCQGMGCYPGDDDGYLSQRKAATPEPLNVTFDASTSLEMISPDNYRNLCDGDVCDYDDSGSQIVITIKRDLNNLSVNAHTGKPIVFKFYGGRKVTKLTLGNNSGLYLTESANVYFGQIIVDGGGDTTLSFESGVRLNIVGDGTDAVKVEDADFQMGNPITFSYIGAGSDYVIPTFYGPTASMHLKSKGVLKAFILAKQAYFDVDVSIEGSVTANYLWVNSGIRVSRTTVSKDCWQSEDPEDDYTLVLSPTSDIALVCKELSPTLSVLSDGVVATDFNGTAKVNIDGIATSVSFINGKATIDLSSGGASKTISINASLDGYSDVNSVSGSYQFVPFKFAVEDQFVIANKQQLATVSTLACSSGKQVDVGFNGQPNVSWQWEEPSNGVGVLTFSPVLEEGISTASSSGLMLEDSGTVTVTLTDDSFDCAELDDCPIDGNGTLKGQFTVYSRPWTFAICSPNNAPMNGNISNASSAGFTSAGNAFALNVRPLRWVSTGNDSDPVSGIEAIETSSYCSSPVTQNFFIAGSELKSTVELTHAVAQPSGGADGTLSGKLVLSNSESVSNSYLPFSGLAWSEVGVLRVNADTQASYFGMNINQGYRDIGRFYPAWLSLISNNWNYSSNHDEFMYMGQPIAYDFVVEAQNMQGGATTNYSSFSPSLIADVKLLSVNTSDDNSEFGSRVEDYDLHFWDGSSQWSGAQLQVSDAPFQFNKLQTTSSPLITRADGPYEDGFGLRVTANSSGVKVDGVDFKTSEAPNLELNSSGVTLDTGKPFSAQPDIRYGRMVLDDVGGTSTSTIYIPLRTEFWNGSRFIENEQDSGSTFVSLGGYVCQQTVWSGSGSASSASLQGADSAVAVTNGVSNKLSAKPHSNVDASSLREQIRFWLRMSDTSPQLSEMNVSCGTSYTNQPWLQYNWRDRGDEDPSAVVTFGVYRGNDRIIFRGESGLTGQ